MTTNEQSVQDLIKSYHDAPYPSFKVSNYFHIYAELFSHLRGQECTFIETGVLNGGSLFMWRNWLGPQARIIGIDLNPNVNKWKNFGFEIYIGDQGDPQFWRETFLAIGPFDVLLDDGGHQSFQQIATLTEGLKAVKPAGLIVVEDTITSYMEDFSEHGDNCFLNYAKTATDTLVAQCCDLWRGEFRQVVNHEVMRQFSQVRSIEFFPGMVAFKMRSDTADKPALVWNKHPEAGEPDFRSAGTSKSLTVNWPDPFAEEKIFVRGR